MKSRVFHTFVLAGMTFEGVMSADGPYVHCKEQRAGVDLGPCQLIKANADDGMVYSGSVFERGLRDNEQGWWLAKYTSELRLNLHHLTDSEAAAFAGEFGISVGNSKADFYESPAWTSLVAWVKENPRVSARYKDTTYYLGDWYGAARAAQVEHPDGQEKQPQMAT